MKKLRYIFVFVLFAGTWSPAFSGKADLFEYDRAEVSQAIQALDPIESLAKAENTTLTEIQQTNPELVEAASLRSNETTVKGTLFPQEPPLGIPSFLWGLCLSWVGILIVYLISESNEETKKALWGCIAGAVLYILFYVIWVFAIAAGSGACLY